MNKQFNCIHCIYRSESTCLSEFKAYYLPEFLGLFHIPEAWYKEIYILFCAIRKTAEAMVYRSYLHEFCIRQVYMTLYTRSIKL